MFQKNRTVWGIAALVSSYLSLFLSVVFAPDNKRVSLSMLLMSLTQLFCGLALIDEEYQVGSTVKSKSAVAYGRVKSRSADLASKVKSKLHTPVVAKDEALADTTDSPELDTEEALDE